LKTILKVGAGITFVLTSFLLIAVILIGQFTLSEADYWNLRQNIFGSPIILGFAIAISGFGAVYSHQLRKWVWSREKR
jgi:hypothetical protein